MIKLAKYKFVVRFSKLAVALSIVVMAFYIIKPFVYDTNPHKNEPRPELDQASYAYDSYAEKPKFQGLDNKNQKYHIEAKSGFQKSKNEIHLDNIIANYTLTNLSVVSLVSKEGDLDIDTQHIVTNGDNLLLYDDKYTLAAQTFDLDYKDCKALGKTNVILTSKIGEIKSDEVELSDNYQIARFFGNQRVKTTLFTENLKHEQN